MKKMMLSTFFIVVLGASSFVDTKTALVWQDDESTRTNKQSWQNAQQYCEDLTLENATDWRLPSVGELRTLIDFGKSKNGHIAGVKYSQPSRYWSSTAHAKVEIYAIAVNFGDPTLGYGGNYQSARYLVRCVRNEN